MQSLEEFKQSVVEGCDGGAGKALFVSQTKLLDVLWDPMRDPQPQLRDVCDELERDHGIKCATEERSLTVGVVFTKD